MWTFVQAMLHGALYVTAGLIGLYFAGRLHVWRERRQAARRLAAMSQENNAIRRDLFQPLADEDEWWDSIR